MIRSRYIVDDFNGDQIQDYVKRLCQTDTLNIFFQSKSFEGKTEQEAEWYATKHSVADFSEELIAKMTNP